MPAAVRPGGHACAPRPESAATRRCPVGAARGVVGHPYPGRPRHAAPGALGASALAATAFGPGAGWVLDRADAVAGLRDDVTGFAALARPHPLVARLARVHRGCGCRATGRVFHHLVPRRSSGRRSPARRPRAATRATAAPLRTEPAPGPRPAAAAAARPGGGAATPYWVFHPLRRRAEAAPTRCAGPPPCADRAGALRRRRRGDRRLHRDPGHRRRGPRPR